MREGSLDKPRREDWEKQQAEMHGCNYVNGKCLTHGTAAPAPKEQPKPKGRKK